MSQNSDDGVFDLHHAMPVDCRVERHLVVDSNLDIVIFIANDRWSRELTIDLDHLSLLPVWRADLPRNNPVPLEKSSSRERQ